MKRDGLKRKHLCWNNKIIKSPRRGIRNCPICKMSSLKLTLTCLRLISAIYSKSMKTRNWKFSFHKCSDSMKTWWQDSSKLRGKSIVERRLPALPNLNRWMPQIPHPEMSQGVESRSWTRWQSCKGSLILSAWAINKSVFTRFASFCSLLSAMLTVNSPNPSFHTTRGLGLSKKDFRWSQRLEMLWVWTRMCYLL